MKNRAKATDNWDGKGGQLRQGDVFLERVTSIPKGAKAKSRDGGRVVLAYGEVTGHAHAIVEPEALLYDLDGDMYLEADGTVTLRHEEHAPVTIDKGLWRVRQQSEYSPAAIRSVQD